MFKIGDFVKIKNSDLYGKIIKIYNNKRNEYSVLLSQNSSVIRIPEDKIELSYTKPNYRNKVEVHYALSSDNFENEIMLRHQTVEVALENLDKFISDAICNKAKRVRIIHGRHGGILRKAVHEYLSNSPYIKEFHLADYYEGSYGVTIAYLK